MEFTLDFSKAIAKKRQGPKSSAQTPAKPDERKKGSSRNEPGSAGTSPDAKEKAEKNLKKKDEKEDEKKKEGKDQKSTAKKPKQSPRKK